MTRTLYICSWVLAAAVATGAFALVPLRVSGESMEPTYKPGDIVIVDTLLWRALGLNRGDVVVLDHPQGRTREDIKRIVGLPRESVVMNSSGVTVTTQDGTVSTFAYGTPVGGTYDGSGGYTTEPDAYFVLGDNRAGSADSRVFGGIPTAYVKGRVLFTL